MSSHRAKARRADVRGRPRPRPTTLSTLAWVLFGLACGRSGPPASSPPVEPKGVAAATDPTPDPGGPAAPPIRVTFTLAEVGLDPAALDRTADPCDDFYQYACGGWLAATEIPASRARWGRFEQIRQKNDELLRSLLERAATAPADESSRRLGAFFGSCMDEAAVEAAGTDAIADLLASAGKVTDAASLAAALAALHRHGIAAVFAHDPAPDFVDPDTIILHLDTAGLGLPDRDYYLDGKGFEPIAKQYRGHVERMFGRLGLSKRDAGRAAADVVRVETELARLTKSRLERRVVARLYHRVDRKGLAALAPGFPWDDYFAGIGFPDLAAISVTTPRYFAGFARLATRLPASAWRSYLAWQIVHATAGTLGGGLAAEAFELTRLTRGNPEPPPRWQRCLAATGEALGDDLGRAFVAAAFAGDSKESATLLFDALVAALRRDLAELAWMSPATRGRAVAKLDQMVRLVGYPDRWQSYDFPVDPRRYAKNALAARAFAVKHQLGKVDHPRDRADWEWPAYTVNASYNWLHNRLTFPAGVLQSPFFAARNSIPVNLGGLGMIAGHELTHGFDDEGSRFGGAGELAGWWLPEDEVELARRSQCLIDQYAAYQPLPGLAIDGKRTVGENLADLGGVKLAYQAYRELRVRDAKKVTADGFDEDQQFFLAVGQAWCSVAREAEVRRRLTIDTHAPPRFRVNGSLRNLPEFGAAFECAEGTPMRPATRCEIW